MALTHYRSLPAYPLSMHPRSAEIERLLISRGRKYVDLCFGLANDKNTRGKGCHRAYTGPFWKLAEISNSNYYEPDAGNVDFHSKPSSQVSTATLYTTFSITYIVNSTMVDLSLTQAGFCLKNLSFAISS